jgi:hypothetical protein
MDSDSAEFDDGSVKAEEFEDILDAQIKRVRDVLVVKAAEYANEDRLANFKTGAALQGCSVPECVSRYMAKHTVSIFDMVQSGKPYPLTMWDEKITDHINYLVLLRAALVDFPPQENPVAEKDH